MCARWNAYSAAELQRTLQWGKFQVVYQPIINLQTGQLAGMGPLVRRIHPQRRRVSPADFIPLAEGIGLILPLDTWVLQEVRRQGARWRAQFPAAPQCSISVNLSASRFRYQELAADVMAMLAETAFPILVKATG